MDLPLGIIIPIYLITARARPDWTRPRFVWSLSRRLQQQGVVVRVAPFGHQGIEVAVGLGRKPLLRDAEAAGHGHTVCAGAVGERHLAAPVSQYLVGFRTPGGTFGQLHQRFAGHFQRLREQNVLTDAGVGGIGVERQGG